MPSIIKSLFVGVTVIMVTIFFIVVLQQDKKTVDSTTVIISLKGLHVAPIESSQMAVPKFASYTDVKEKKRAFFSYLLPEIRRQNSIVEKEREMVFALLKLHSDNHAGNKPFNQHELAVLALLKKKYKLNSTKQGPIEDVLAQLVIRVDVIPEQLILVQAANESG
ncbi:MAG: mannosyl-glycoprotein endo-beta-N-acetylglucosamidase, partial [Paraglaciecola sp.]|nr:mannosyl-glycoprotein endo-beta-N-acetylglucosamidase [Paraglaciecola sp.]